MAKEAVLPFSMASVVEDVLKQNGTRVRNIDMVSRKAEEAALRRYEAAAWLRKTVGFVLSKDLPEEPSEEEFRLGLRSGIILCSALNKVQPGSVPRVVERPSAPVPDGAALTAYQYFENVRNFLDSVQEMGIPTFEPSDFEQGGKSVRIVNCVLALKSYNDWKQGGGNSLWKFGGTLKSSTSAKIVRKNSELFMTSLSRSQSADEKSLDAEHSLTSDVVDDSIEMTASSLNMLVRAALSDKKPEEVPTLVESMLSKVMEEFERRLASHNAEMKTTLDGLGISDGNNSLQETASGEMKTKAAPEEDPAAVSDDHKSIPETNYGEMKIQQPKLEDENATDTRKDEEEEEEESTTEIDKEEEEEYTIETKKDEAVHTTETKKDDVVNYTTETKKYEEEENAAETKKHEEENAAEIKKWAAEIKKREEENAAEIKKRDEEIRRLIKQQQLTDQKKQEEEKHRLLKQQQLIDQQQRDIQELKHILSTTKDGMRFMQTKYHEEFNNLGKHLNVLTHAASRYHRVLEENRKLYNQVQDLKGSIRVYCRVRPFLPGQASKSSIVDHIDEGSIEILTPSKYGKEGRKSFNFNKVFGPAATQQEVFLDTQPLIRSVLDGFNVCIFAYGQTGSGKTHTMTGPSELTEETQGVNFRALNDLFYLSEQRKETFCYEVSVQMMEIYNEQVRDLLVTDGLNKRLEIRNSSSGLNVPDANLVPVASTTDVIELMNVGQKNRAVCSTALNDRSSRSHSCLTVHVQGRDLASGTTLRGCMHLVDLAGSERVNKSEVQGDRLKEAVHINKSLSALGDVIAALAQKHSHVPYRNSKLTQLLQDSLGGHAKTLMFVHISPDPDAIGETLSTLKFAERVATVELGAAKTNSDSGDVKELKEQINSLKAALARKEGGESLHLPRSISSSSISSSRRSSPERPTIKSGGGSLPLYSEIVKGGASTRKQATEVVGNVDVVNFQKEDEKEFGSRDWVDKVMVNKLEMVNGNENESSQEHWEVDSNSKLPALFYQKLNSKVHPEHGVKGGKKENHDYEQQRPRFEMATTTDDSDDLEATTSECSEPDLLYQSNLPRVSSVPTSLASKLRKPSQIPGRSPDQSGIPKTSSIPSLGSSPARKMSNGVGPPLHRNGRQPVAVGGKKKTGYGK